MNKYCKHCLICKLWGPGTKGGNESVRQVFLILLLNFQKYKIQQQVHIYIYAFIYVGYTEKQ